MGTVYLGADAAGRFAAVKVVRSDHLGDDTFRQRFRREVAAAARVRSRFTADLIAAEADAPEPWLATQYVPGPTLTEAVSDRGPLPEAAVRDLVAGVAEALWAIHNTGLVHRDLKPSNVLLGPDGPCVIDLGVVRTSEATTLTTTGLQIGTPMFMAPEQARGDVVTPAADIWALGGLAYFAATGDRLFGAGQPSAVLYRVVHTEPDLSGCPAGLRPLIAACLAKDPAARPSAAAILAAVRPGTRPAVSSGPTASGSGAAPTDPPFVAGDPELTGAATHLAATGFRTPVNPNPVSPAPAAPPTGPRRRRLVIAGAIAAGVVLLGAGVATALVMQQQAKPLTEGAPSVVVSVPATETSAPATAVAVEPTSSAEPSAEPVPSTPVVETEPATPAPVGPSLFTAGGVTLAGNAVVGQTLTVAADGFWSPAPDPALTTCAWYKGSNRLQTDGTCSYIVAPGDVGHMIGATLVAAHPGYESTEVPSPKSATVVRAVFAVDGLTVSGKATVGSTVTCNVPGLEKYPAAQRTFQWLRGEWKDGVATKVVFGTNSPTAKLPAETADHSVWCRIKLSQGGYDDLDMMSSKFGFVSAAS
ncbi:protein kinase [Antribacter sp. KLBMP9083]|uniref:Protein kinase n=2 Tax=Antribacter soli TaxID=2910976 RepID=A0AA41QBH2_9MICO|nr:protein kinase [Antribacter soli]